MSNIKCCLSIGYITTNTCFILFNWYRQKQVFQKQKPFSQFFKYIVEAIKHNFCKLIYFQKIVN